MARRRRNGIRVSEIMVTAACMALAVSAAGAAEEWPAAPADPYGAQGGYEIYGDFVMNVGELHVNITNFGLIGSAFSSGYAYSHAPSAQWPAGSDDEYLYSAGLWVGGVVLGERRVSNSAQLGEYEIRARDEPEGTIYEARDGQLVRPDGLPDAAGRRFPEPEYDDDGDGLVDEELLNGHDDDGDGRVEEDFGQVGNQMMVTTLYDNTRSAIEEYADHEPLQLEVVQESFAWENDVADDFVGFQYTITNVGVTDIQNVYIGFYVDADIGPRNFGDTAADDMAGSWVGVARAADGSPHLLEVGYMYDAAVEHHRDGYVGIVFLGHDVDPEGVRAPASVGLRTFQHFAPRKPFEEGGDPRTDDERYQLMSAEPDQWDGNVQPGRANDFRFLVSAGPFQVLEPDESLQFQVALVVGPGLDGLLRNCAEAMATWRGAWFDVVGDYVNEEGVVVRTGVNGRETRLCREDFADPGEFDAMYPDFGDESCLDADWLMHNADPLAPEDIFIVMENGRRSTCAMVNLDNCFECFTRKNPPLGTPPDLARCTSSDFETLWNCRVDSIPASRKDGCTGIEGRETAIHWLVGMAPPPPGMRLWPTDQRVHVYWDDSSEHAPDLRLGLIDFESYRIWRADNWTRPYGTSVENGPASGQWQLVAEYDVVDSFTVVHVVPDGDDDGQAPDSVTTRLPLGANTGLASIGYRPRVLDDPRFSGLDVAMQEVVDADPEGLHDRRPPMYGGDGQVLPICAPIERWNAYPDVLDTFWAVTARQESLRVDPVDSTVSVVVVGKPAVRYYEYVDHAVHNGFLYFYSVTATDHELTAVGDADPPTFTITGEGLSGDPSSRFQNTSPATEAQSAADRQELGKTVFVYPNPATRDALRQFQQLNPNADDPTGVRVNFANLPASLNTIRVYTLAGDLVQVLEHDGRQGYGEKSWNLMSRNGQEVVSGIYLYVVQSRDAGFDDVIGKFVLVR